RLHDIRKVGSSGQTGQPHIFKCKINDKSIEVQIENQQGQIIVTAFEGPSEFPQNVLFSLDRHVTEEKEKGETVLTYPHSEELAGKLDGFFRHIRTTTLPSNYSSFDSSNTGNESQSQLVQVKTCPMMVTNTTNPSYPSSLSNNQMMIQHTTNSSYSLSLPSDQIMFTNTTNSSYSSSLPSDQMMFTNTINPSYPSSLSSNQMMIQHTTNSSYSSSLGVCV
ncbi:unnamed protein product, partial [Rotaria sordida]